MAVKEGEIKKNPLKKKRINFSKMFSSVFVNIKKVMEWMWRNKIKIIIVVFSFWVIMSVINFFREEPFYINILPGERGVIFNKLGGGISDIILSEGTHFIFSPLQVIYRARVSRQSAIIERVTADSREFQDVALWLNIEFQLTEENLPSFFRLYGIKSSDEIINDIIIPNTNEVTKNIIIDYPIADVLPNQKKIKETIKTNLQSVLKQYFISVIDVDVINIKLAPEFREIIAQTEFAVYEKEKAELLLDAAMVDAERRILEAETLKKEKILEAEAIQEYNRLISEKTMDPVLLEYMRIENQRAAIDKWDGKLPMQINDSNNLPFIEGE